MAAAVVATEDFDANDDDVVDTDAATANEYGAFDGGGGSEGGVGRNNSDDDDDVNQSMKNKLYRIRKDEINTYYITMYNT